MSTLACEEEAAGGLLLSNKPALLTRACWPQLTLRVLAIPRWKPQLAVNGTAQIPIGFTACKRIGDLGNRETNRGRVFTGVGHGLGCQWGAT